MKLLVMSVQRALAQLNKMKSFTFILTEEQLNIIATGLNELPGKLCNPVLQELTKQLQNQPAPETTEAKAEFVE